MRPPCDTLGRTCIFGPVCQASWTITCKGSHLDHAHPTQLAAPCAGPQGRTCTCRHRRTTTSWNAQQRTTRQSTTPAQPLAAAPMNTYRRREECPVTETAPADRGVPCSKIAHRQERCACHTIARRGRRPDCSCHVCRRAGVEGDTCVSVKTKLQATTNLTQQHLQSAPESGWPSHSPLKKQDYVTGIC